MRINNEPLLRQLVGSKLKTRILEFLTGNKVPTSEREMAKIFGVSHTAVNKAMKELLEFNLVQATNIGSSLVWTINKKSTSYQILHMYLRLQKTSVIDIIIERLHDKLFLLDLFASRGKKHGIAQIMFGGGIDAYLFGSTIDNTAGPESDIDMLIIPRNKENAKELERQKNMLNKVCIDFAEEIGNKLSIHIHTKEDIKTNPALHWAKEVLANPRKGRRVYP
ncbi:TPA: GntR family transcriptional regulator [Candidatus Woesearchaeota archaeon]|nr:GntR family transcriptional regulator [Candidatus Woesearchaeota archaeon]